MKVTNVMSAICSKCGASIKNIVDINGKSYGTSCAETVLGVRLPNNFSGDGVKFRDDKLATDAERMAEFKQMIEITVRGWNINIYFTKAYKSAKNDWERNFVQSCADKVASTVLTYLKELSFDNAKRDWDSNYMGSFPYRSYDLNQTFNNLSEKQLSILNKIYPSTKTI